MSAAEYAKACKMAQKIYRQDMAERRYPYLKVLDEILPFVKTAGERDLGLIEIPIERIVGTKTAGRTKAFASNFMPLLSESSEFASKWITLYNSHIEEGIREPVIACEFMNEYYIIEGNKRVSVLKYSGAVSVSGYVTRIIPVLDDSKEVKIYYEFMDFNRDSRMNTIYFTRPGSFRKLCELTGKEPGEPWSEDDRRLLSSCLLHFSKVFREKGGGKIGITPGDALLVYLNVYGYEGMVDKPGEMLKKELAPLWDDIEALPEAEIVNVVMQPEEERSKNLIQKLIEPVFLPHRLKVGFLYYRTAKSSSWTYNHDLGRLYLENNMAGQLDIHVYDGIETDEQCLEQIEQAVKDGCTVLFTTSPRFLGPSMKAGMKHPQVKILNCSLNSYSGHMRTYYGRLYEAKFLVGMLAGILTRTEGIGYIADFPIFGTPAAVNAFSLGVKMVNPTAKVHLAWSTRKDCDVYQLLTDACVSHISGRELLAPLHSSRKYGLYDLEDEKGKALAVAIWHWGKFYQRILQTILNGNWKRTSQVHEGESVNYWWGISSGMIDLACSQTIPERTRALVELVRKQIVNGSFQIFSGDIPDQQGVMRCAGNRTLTPEEIIRMDWLADNVVGEIPTEDQLVEEAVSMVKIQGIYSANLM